MVEVVEKAESGLQTQRNELSSGHAVASKTRLTETIKNLDVDATLGGLDETPALLEHRDDRGRNWLHLTCAIGVEAKGLDPARSIALAAGLLERGIDINAPAFTEGDWHATPLWYAVGRGRNLPLVRFLLESGSTPEHCLWAASFNDDTAIIRQLLAAGASLETVVEDETPFFGAVKYSKFTGAQALLEGGANPNWIDPNGRTAMHAMLKKGSDSGHFEMFVQHGARSDIPDRDGKTVDAILRRKRDVVWHELAERLARANH